MWAGSVPASFSHWNVALSTHTYTHPHSGHLSKDTISSARNRARPRKSPSGRQIPTGLEASGARKSPSMVAQLPLLRCFLSVLQE